MLPGKLKESSTEFASKVTFIKHSDLSRCVLDPSTRPFISNRFFHFSFELVFIFTVNDAISRFGTFVSGEDFELRHEHLLEDLNL